MDGWFVFIVAGPAQRALRTGLTRDPALRACRSPAADRLLYFELCADADAACRRQRQLRHWSHARRARLVSTMNPLWRDLRTLW